METIQLNYQEIRQQWLKIKEEKPQTRAREAAQVIGISEAELVASQALGRAVRLDAKWPELLVEFKKLGRVMSLTRNEACVLEHKGSFQKIDIQGNAPHQIATVIGPIEQRVFFHAWKFGFSVAQESPRGTMLSFQFFDGNGQAVMKVFLQEKSNTSYFSEITLTYAHPDQESIIETSPYSLNTYTENPDIEAFRKDWEGMQDTHEFFGMLRKHQIAREQALQVIGKPWAEKFSLANLEKLLEEAAKEKLPIMIFAGNKGNIQIHQGKIKTIRRMGNWLNVLDPDFNMHLDESLIANAWVVRKPTSEGPVTSIELFDTNGELMAQFFGLRKPSIPELKAWTAMVEKHLN